MAENKTATEEKAPPDPQQAPGNDTPAEPPTDSAQEKLLRLAADFDNFRRRMAKENALERQRGRRDAALRVVAVFDSIQSALSSIPKHDAAMRAGIEAVGAQLLAGFDALGIKRTPTVGQPFDPNVHEALGNMPHDTVPEGRISAEARAGFFDDLGMLRPAQVIVSTGKGGK